jgi:hypothetical protein
MLLQGSQPIKQQPQAVPAPAEPAHAEPALAGPAPAEPVGPRRYGIPTSPGAPTGRAYPPIVWTPTPSLGRTVAEGLGGIARTTVLLIVALAAVITVTLTVAILVANAVGAFGVDPSSSY